MTEENYVLKFLTKDEIDKYFDRNAYLVVEYLLKKVLFSQPELLPGEKPANIQMTKEFLEGWISQAFTFEKVGAGSYPIDVYDKENRCGIDIKCISAKVDLNGKFTSEQSNETSLGQNFKKEGLHLDELFKDKKYAEILSLWKGLLTNKVSKAVNDFELEKILYFIFIRGGNSMNLAVAELNPENIEKLTVGSVTKKSVFVNNYMDPNYGNARIYKSKKRMELRTCAKRLYEDGMLLEWNFNEAYSQKNMFLRDKVQNEKEFREYVKKEFEDLFFNGKMP
ncbi:hypothetical protein HNP88_000790 [Methanococcus maripaludis]|uniref:Uncharacterized protein n=1 Tax=Methanococcus maripaludis TaxID=39152 RepID=A0A7J9NN86_METMI|nr:hypothetical protein [Methanococcus maripaludis]MBA2846606.1 hypothetical protein [Methanococcus maripaludis]